MSTHGTGPDAGGVRPRRSPSLALRGRGPDRARPAADRPPPRRPRRPRLDRDRRPRPASAAAERTPATPDPRPTITYSIWGDPQEIKNQQAIVDAFHAANPKITVKVTVSDWEPYWDKLQTGDRRRRRARRVRDGRPALPRLPVARRPARPQAVHRPRRLRPDAARRPGGRRLHDARRPVRPAARPQRRRALLQQDDVRRGRHPLPGRDLGLGEAGRRRQAADRSRTPTARSASGASTPRRTDMENYWSSLVWQNGGDIISADHKTSLVGSDQAAGGIQFLQDLIWKDKVMPDPAIWPTRCGDAFEQGQAAMESNGSWLVATAPGRRHRLRDRPAAEGPGRTGHVDQPDRARSSSRARKNPDAAWEFVKYLASPAAQTKLMELKASLPANKEVLAGPFATVVPGRRRPRRRDRLRPPQAVVQGLQRLDDRAPDGARRERLQRRRTRRPSRRSPTCCRSSTRSSPAQ